MNCIDLLKSQVSYPLYRIKSILKSYLYSQKDSDEISVFDSFNTSITFNDYFKRIVLFGDFEESTIICAFILLNRLFLSNKINLTRKNINKLFFSLVLLSCKHLEDRLYNIQLYSKLSGIDTKQICLLENKLLEILDYSFPINERIYHIYYSYLNKSSK